METIKVKPWGDGQGDHVVINAEDFNPEIHVLAEGENQTQEVEEVEVEGEDAPAKRGRKPRNN